ncbi:MAG: hypothetical protein HQL52_13615 [Magnetococcales bacterium]|nr:hypothetical protein [Magnetococcales bacterium]
MDNTIPITLDQLDAINRSLNKAMAVSRVLANCGPGKRPMTDPPEAVDLFLVMQMVLEEMEGIWTITKKLGGGLPE